MRYHVVLSRRINLEVLTEEAGRGLRPRHAMKQLAVRLGAEVHMPEGQAPSLADKVKAKLVSTPELWAYARHLARKFESNDVIYCSDEAIGLPLAALCSNKRSRPKIVVMAHNVDRPRARLALRINAGFRSPDVFLAVSERQIDFLRSAIGIEKERALFVHDQTDLMFFHPGPPSPDKRRPLLVGAGLERRDYRVFADAAADLDLDVCVTGFSADASPGTSSFPNTWPENFSRRRYEWIELADLYRNADAVVITLLPNNYAAGITTMVEGMASGRPIIVTQTEGLKGYLEDADALTLVAPESVTDLRNAIVSLLASGHRGAVQGHRALQIAQERYGSDTHVETIARILEKVGSR